MIIAIDFRLFFKENSGLPSDVESTQVPFNSMFVNGMNWDPSLLVKRTSVKWETVSAPDLVHLANQLSGTLDELPPRKTTKIFNSNK